MYGTWSTQCTKFSIDLDSTTSQPKTQSNFRIYLKRNYLLNRNSRTEAKQEINNNVITRNKRSSSRARVSIQILFHFDSYFIYFFTRFWFLAAARCLLRFFSFIFISQYLFVQWASCLLSNSETMCECVVGFRTSWVVHECRFARTPTDSDVRCLCHGTYT